MRNLTFFLLFLLSATGLTAKESYGKWTPKYEAQYTMKIVDHMKKDFEKRRLNLMEAGTAVTLDYKFYHPPLDKKQKRTQEKFLKGKLKKKDHKEQIKSYIDDLNQVSSVLLMAELAYGDKKISRAEHYRNGMLKKEIYGVEIESERMSVIMDNSRSMAPYIPAIKNEIKTNFSDAYFIEVDGSAIYQEGNFTWYFIDPYKIETAFLARNHCHKISTKQPFVDYLRWNRDNYSAILALATTMESDAIYWFCDMEDRVSEKAIIDLGKIVLKQKVKLYIHTMSKRPNKLLTELAKRSGGAVIRKKIRK